MSADQSTSIIHRPGATPGPVESPPVLDYVSTAHGSGKLSLIELHGEVRVFLPVAPRWSYIGNVVTYAVCGLMKISLAVWMAVTFHHLFHAFPGAPSADQNAMLHRFEANILTGGAASATFWWSLAGIGFWRWRRWGRVPRVFTANSAGLVKSWLGWFRMRERRWPAGEITNIELRRRKWNSTHTVPLF